jgi:NAD(P)-dependent dehydrogenase (short-subunit alcohol dehydrogenase family)
MVQKFMERNPAVKYAIENLTPLKQADSVEEVADYIVFPCSPSASFINGTALPIDAGLTLPPPPPLSRS